MFKVCPGCGSEVDYVGAEPFIVAGVIPYYKCLGCGKHFVDNRRGFLIFQGGLLEVSEAAVKRSIR